mgnify:CR=1 FL=1
MISKSVEKKRAMLIILWLFQHQVRPSLQKKMQHDHLKFYSHGSSGVGNQQIGSFQLGGSGVVPILIGGQGGNGRPSGADSQKARSTVEKHIEIVEYLKKLPDSSWVSVTHFILH